MIRKLAATGALATSLAASVPAQAATVRPPVPAVIYDVNVGSSLTVFHKSTGPGGQEIPWVRASMHLFVARPPRGGVVGRMILQYRRGLAATWIFAGAQPGWHSPWHHGWTKAETIEYVCVYNKSWWRIKLSYDIIRYNGQPDVGTYYYPSKRGARQTCVVIAGARVREAGQ